MNEIGLQYDHNYHISLRLCVACKDISKVNEKKSLQRGTDPRF